MVPAWRTHLHSMRPMGSTRPCKGAIECVSGACARGFYLLAPPGSRTQPSMSTAAAACPPAPALRPCLHTQRLALSMCMVSPWPQSTAIESPPLHDAGRASHRAHSVWLGADPCMHEGKAVAGTCTALHTPMHGAALPALPAALFLAVHPAEQHCPSHCCPQRSLRHCSLKGSLVVRAKQVCHAQRRVHADPAGGGRVGGGHHWCEGQGWKRGCGWEEGWWQGAASEPREKVWVWQGVRGAAGQAAHQRACGCTGAGGL